MNPYDSGYAFIQGLIGMLLALWPIAGPFVILGAIVWVFSMVGRFSRGKQVDE